MTVVAATTSDDASTRRTKLYAGEILKLNEEIYSPEGEIRLILQGDSNLCLYQVGSRSAIWSSDTQGQGVVKAVMQHDGNFVLYRNGGQEVWSTGTAGRGNSTSNLVVRNDANVVVSSDDIRIWSIKPVPRANLDRLARGEELYPDTSMTSRNGRFKFTLQDDGNFVLYDGAASLWSASSNGAGKVILQTDGNLVAYQGKQPKWASGTEGRGDRSTIFIMQDDGDAVIFTAGKRIWATNTKPRLSDRLRAGQTPIRYPASIENTDHLRRGERLGRGQELVSGDWKLTFTDSGHIKVTNAGGQTTFYYMDPPVSGASQLLLNDQCHLELRDDQDDLLAAHFRYSSDPGSERPSHFILGNDGLAYIFVNGSKMWAMNDLAVGSSPEMPSYDNILHENRALRRGNGLTSSNGRYRFAFRDDGNLVVYNLETKSIIWSTDFKSASGSLLILRSDGNLVLDHEAGFVQSGVWASGTGGKGTNKENKLVMQNDGNLVIYTGEEMIWSTRTSGR